MKILKIRLRVAYLRKDKAKVIEGAYGKNRNPQNKRSIANLDEDVHLPRLVHDSSKRDNSLLISMAFNAFYITLIICTFRI